MNRRTLFKRAGKLGLGLGLGAVLGTGVAEAPDVNERALAARMGPSSGFTVPIVEHKYKPFEVDDFNASVTITGSQTYGYGERQGGAV